MPSSFKFALAGSLVALVFMVSAQKGLAHPQQSKARRAVSKWARLIRATDVSSKSTADGESAGADARSVEKRAEISTDTTDTAVKVRALEDALRSQNEKLEQMRGLIEEQHRLIQSLSARVGGAGSVASSNSPSNETEPMDRTANKEPSSTIQRSDKQTPSLEERVQKVEERVAKVGPLRLSGDFRLRLDATLREATRPPEPPLAHAQNVRMRYRLRLNMDAELHPTLNFHGQLSTGPFNNALTADQDFTSTVARHPFSISEAWIDYHPNKSIQLQGGRLQEIFADNSRFLFDDDVRFNGFNEKVALKLGDNQGKTTTLELRAGQYWFSNPSVAVIAPGSPLARAGAAVGTIGRSAMLFHQGAMLNQQVTKQWTQQFGADVQLFREPNQIQLASTADGVVFLVQPGLGLALSGPMTGTGNATTTPGGAIYSARSFQVGRLAYRVNHSGFEWGARKLPFSFNLQLARNFGTGRHERDAMLTAIQLGRPSSRGDMAFLYVFSIKGANSMISQLTDDDLGTGTGVNIRTHHLRWDVGLAKNVTLQSLLFVQRQLRNSGQFENFFVPLGAFAPRQYRFQEQILFSF